MTQPNSEARDKILSRLRAVSTQNWHKNWPEQVPEGEVFPPVTDLLAQFSEELSTLGGQVFVGDNRQALYAELKRLAGVNGWEQLVTLDQELYQEMDEAGVPVTNQANFEADFEVGVTRCEALVALLGSVMVCASGPSGRRMNVFPPVHVVVAGLSQMVPSIANGFERIEKKDGNQLPSQITLISGPSRTADIEKTLVMGAHGPRELIVLIDLDA